MTHRDRAGDPSGQRAGRREAAGDAGHRQGFPAPPSNRPLPVRLRDRNGGFPRLSARGRTASRMAFDVPHRYAARSWPKALGNRLYGSLSARFGIKPWRG